MYDGRYVFSQLMDFLPRADLDRCVRRHRGQRRVRTLTCREQFLCMAFAQLTGRDSLRELVRCLRALTPRLYHAGIRTRVSRSTLADANASRPWRIWADLAATLITQARRLYADHDFGLGLEEPAYVLDATVIELCWSLFPWAHAQRQKGGVKLHTLMDLRGDIPCFISVSSTKTRDATAIDHLFVEPGAFYIMDRGYNDYARLHHLHRSGAWFVLRAKNNLNTTPHASRPVDKSTGLRADQTVKLGDRRTRRKYPDKLRRITYRDAEHGRRFVFMTNNLLIPAFTVTQLYRRRWRIELLFKWLKQHLRIKRFFGTTPNALHTQVWIAVSVYVLLAIIRKTLALDRPLSEILEIASLTLFEKTPLIPLFSSPHPETTTPSARNQLSLFDF